MRVLMIPSFFKNMENESSGSFFLDQAVALATLGNEVYIIYPDVYSIKHIKKYFRYREKNEVISSVHIIRKKAIAPFKHNGIFGAKKAFESTCLKIIEENWGEEFPFDVIHAQNCIWAGAAAKKLADKYNVPFVVTEHSSLFDGKNEKMLKRLGRDIKIIYDCSKKVICVSSRLKDDVKKYTRQDVKVIGNVVDIDSFSGDNTKKTENRFTFICVAFLSTEERIKQKGIPLLVDSFEAFSKKCPNAVLKIVGVPEKSPLKRQINVYSNIMLIKPLKRNDLANEMKLSDCFIMLSEYETFGVVFAEAMAAGLPVISTDVGIAQDIITNETGIICNRNINEISDAMSYVFNKNSSFNSDCMKKRIASLYSQSVIANQISEVYLSIQNK